MLEKKILKDRNEWLNHREKLGGSDVQMQKLYLDLKKKSRKRIPLQRMTYKIAFLVIRKEGYE